MSLLTDVQTAATTFIAKVADLVTQTGYLIDVITGPSGGSGSLVNVGPRVLKTLSRTLLEIEASQAFTPRGVWSAVTTYAELDGVSRNGVAYVSMADSNLNNPPESSPLFWMQLVPSVFVVVDTDAPAIPFEGLIWIDKNSAAEFAWMTDGDSSQWVEI